MLDGILWILQTGEQWADMPQQFPPKSTCHRRFQEWTESDVFSKILTGLARSPKERGGVDLSEDFIDGTFAPAKKGATGEDVGKIKKGKGTKIMGLTGASGLLIAIGAQLHEIKLIEQTLEACFIEHVLEKVIGDKAYDSDKLDQKLTNERGVDLIAPHQGNRKQPATQDGRVLRRYKKRLKVERLFAWLQNFHRLVVRYEYHLKNFLAMVQLGCILIL